MPTLRILCRLVFWESSIGSGKQGNLRQAPFMTRLARIAISGKRRIVLPNLATCEPSVADFLPGTHGFGNSDGLKTRLACLGTGASHGRCSLRRWFAERTTTIIFATIHYLQSGLVVMHAIRCRIVTQALVFDGRHFDRCIDQVSADEQFGIRFRSIDADAG